jgi:hypothetical protein
MGGPSEEADQPHQLSLEGRTLTKRNEPCALLILRGAHGALGVVSSKAFDNENPVVGS